MVCPFTAITAVIPAYNEAPRILDSISPLVKLGIRIIVVDDGSTDNTSTVVKKFTAHASSHTNVKVIKHPQNKGKAYAMSTGLSYVETKYVLFWDADIKDYDLKKFAECLRKYNKSCSGVLIFTTRRKFIDRLNQRALSGQRLLPTALAKQFFNAYTAQKLDYLIETYMNRYLLTHKIHLFECIINFKHATKAVKYGPQGLLADLKMAMRLIFNRNFIYSVKTFLTIKRC